MKYLRRIIASSMALSIVLCAATGISSYPADNLSVAHAEDTIELSNGMTFSARYKNGKFLDTELTLISYTGNESDLVIPESVGGLTVTAIDHFVFKDNMYISSVTLPDTINCFGSGVFQNSTLMSVNIPKSLRIIPDYTFSGCIWLDNVTFHDNIAIIGRKAFQATGIVLPDELLPITQFDNVSSSDQSLNKTEGKWNLLINTDDTGDVYAEIFSYYGDETDLVIPEDHLGIPIIGISRDKYFYDENITSIVFPSTFTKPANFSDHKGLKRITFLGDCISIGQFSNTGIEELFLPVIANMEKSAFANCTDLRKVTFTNTSEPLIISDSAFYKCTSLEEIVIPESSESISIGSNAFFKCGLKNLELYGNADISSYSFRECNSLKTLVSNGTLELEHGAFLNCDSLENITLNTKQKINGLAFNGCVNLMNIGSAPAFDSITNDFREDIKDFVFNNFNNANDVGFINLYVKSQVEKIVEEYTDDSMSDMQKIKVLHDWVCDNTVYNFEDISDRANHNDAALFMNDKAVCEGYARAMNLLLNAAGIESYYVNSDDHAWNIVKLGGHYFHIDSTWDDGDEISYSWFLKSDSELKAAGGSHENWSLFMPSSLHSFQKDVLPECKYSMGDLNMDGKTDCADLVLLSDYILGESDVDPNDIVLADLNFDGVADSFDVTCMRQLLNCDLQ